MLFRPAPKYRVWCDTKLGRVMDCEKLALIIVGRHFSNPCFNPVPANDRDHCRW
jgi:hypothetical protein